MSEVDAVGDMLLSERHAVVVERLKEVAGVMAVPVGKKYLKHNLTATWYAGLLAPVEEDSTRSYIPIATC